MRWLAVTAVCLVSCSHSKTTPPSSEPLAPATMAASAPAVPASAPAIGHDSGDHMNGGHMAMAPREPLDLVSSMTAGSGKRSPEGLTWTDEVGNRPASKLFKNVKVLGDVTGFRFMTGMQSMEVNLGQKCGFCHDMDKFSLDAKPEKVRARQMIQMAFEVDRDYFRGNARVSCYTCHRGQAEPSKFDLAALHMAKSPTPLPELSAADQKKPAPAVWKNIQVLTEVPAGKIPFVMGVFTGVLGVDCAHCHVEGNWASDDKHEKIRAREMVKMVKFIDGTYFTPPAKDQVSCWTCHQGSDTPPKMAVAAAVPSAP